MATVTGYVLDLEKMTYITTGGRVVVSGDADVEVPLMENSVFEVSGLKPGSYLVSILDVPYHNPGNKFFDISSDDEYLDIGWLAVKKRPGHFDENDAVDDVGKMNFASNNVNDGINAMKGHIKNALEADAAEAKSK